MSYVIDIYVYSCKYMINKHAALHVIGKFYDESSKYHAFVDELSDLQKQSSSQVVKSCL